jgi:hypothetical protein
MFVVPFDIAKLGSVIQLRRSLPKTPSGVAGADAKTTVFVAFDQPPSAENRFFPNGKDVYEQRGCHQLVVRFSEAEPQWDTVSFVTSIMYLDERLNTLSFHPFESRMKYRQAVAETEQLFRRLGLHDEVDWGEYDRRLDTLIETHEVYIPRIAMASARVQPYMNCGWDFDALPRGQLDRVECYPIVYVTPTTR